MRQEKKGHTFQKDSQEIETQQGPAVASLIDSSAESTDNAQGGSYDNAPLALYGWAIVHRPGRRGLSREENKTAEGV